MAINSVNKRYVPKLRFKGFNEFWKITKIENEFFIKKGVQINKSLIHQNGKFYHLNGGLTYSNKCNKWNTNKNTISISEGGESCGYISWNDQKFWAGGHLYTLDVLNSQNNSKYLYYVLKKNEKLIMNLRVGSSIPNIQKKDLFSFKISISINNEEQIKISNFLSLLDKQISLLENKLKLTEQLKHNYSKNLFANKSNTPKLRFKGFIQNLRIFSLKDFGESNGGTSLEKFFNKTDKYKVINIGSYTKDNKYRDQGIRIGFNDKSKNKILNINDLVMVLNDKTPNGNIIGRVILIDEDNKYVYNQRNQRIIVGKEFDSKFLFYFLNCYNNRKKIIAYSKGNTQIYVNWKDIEMIKYFVPNQLEEQTKISNFLLLLDKQIDNVSRKIEIIKNQKKFFLNNLFI